MFKLRKKRPPFGTDESPIWEYAYSEQVKVVNGLCEIQHESTREYLLKLGYVDADLEEALVASHQNGVHDTAEPPPQKSPPISSKKKRRWR